MGLVYAMLQLINPRRPELPPVEVEALADTGAVCLVIPEIVREQLQLGELEKREVTLADGKRKLVPYAGPVQLHFKNRSGFFGALVMGDQVLLGAIPMEDLDLIVVPKDRRVDINPEHPNYAHALVKSFTPSSQTITNN
jgi:clan AA aspartic protease